jgi:hypothetical protein
MKDIINELLIYYVLVSLMVTIFNVTAGYYMFLSLFVFGALFVVMAVVVTLLSLISNE